MVLTFLLDDHTSGSDLPRRQWSLLATVTAELASCHFVVMYSTVAQRTVITATLLSLKKLGF